MNVHDSGGPLDALDPRSMSMSLGGKGALSPSTAGDAGNSNTPSVAFGEDIPSYPPTEVRRWLTCPVFRQYSRKWQPRAEAWTPHKIVGTAIHAGVAAYLRSKMSSETGKSTSPELPSDPLVVATKTLSDGYVEQETWAKEGLEALTRKGVHLILSRLDDLLLGPPMATIVAIELVDPTSRLPDGVTVPRTIDCILERGEGLEVWDWKTHMRLDDQYLGRPQWTLIDGHWVEPRIEDQRPGDRARAVLHSWQLLDYAWHVQEWFKRPVSWAGYGEVILAPKARVEFLPVKLSPERLTQWRKDAEIIWAEMRWTDDSGYPPWHNWEACSDRHLHFGKECVYMPACHELNGNESLFSGVYELRGDDGLRASDEG